MYVQSPDTEMLTSSQLHWNTRRGMAKEMPTVKPIFGMPYISQISRPWRLCENNGLRMFNQNCKNAKITGAKII